MAGKGFLFGLIIGGAGGVFLALLATGRIRWRPLPVTPAEAERVPSALRTLPEQLYHLARRFEQRLNVALAAAREAAEERQRELLARLEMAKQRGAMPR